MKLVPFLLSLCLLLSAGFPSNTQAHPATSSLEVVEVVTFKLRNTSAQSIRLNIPKVMNPNLSPFSDSGVNLKVGQKIFFYHKGKKHLLLSVTEELEGEVLNVPALIREKKQELKQEKK